MIQCKKCGKYLSIYEQYKYNCLCQECANK